MTRFILSIFCLIAFAAVASPARAADTAAPAAVSADAPKAAEKKEEPKKEEAKKEDAAPAPAAAADAVSPEQAEQKKAAEEVFAETKAIAANISPEEQKHFFMMYNNYNIIGTVKMVQGDVGKAVQSCSEKNPEMKADLDKNYKDWNDSVNPVIQDAQKNIDNMIIAQNYAKPEQIQKVFKGLDKTRELTAKQIEKTPVTTKDACAYLQDKMSDTKENFTRLLRGTLMSVPKAIPAEPAQSEHPPAAAPGTTGDQSAPAEKPADKKE